MILFLRKPGTQNRGWELSIISRNPIRSTRRLSKRTHCTTAASDTQFIICISSFSCRLNLLILVSGISRRFRSLGIVLGGHDNIFFPLLLLFFFHPQLALFDGRRV
ncbi:hypothetical protein K438DRAFT_705540 [Mycena galopus ATCC 62051]|nr:hypothetical protein K438DRAFT_705540 [Mycena galopus ATCC 62051]